MQISEIFNKQKKVALDNQQVVKIEAALELIQTNAEKGLKALQDLDSSALKSAMDEISKYENKIYNTMTGKG